MDELGYTEEQLLCQGQRRRPLEESDPDITTDRKRSAMAEEEEEEEAMTY